MRTKNPDGSKTRYVPMDPDVWQEILDRLIEGESLLQICRDPNLPSRPAVYWWIARNDQMLKEYKLARDAGMESWEDELLQIADDIEGDCARDRLRIDARKWLMAKIKPQKYSDSVKNVHVGGDDDDKPIQHSVITFKAASDD